jgi:NAD(P)-dependent dehydrogenase (short-subunit alcohol dehydrogenase family)
MQATRQPPWRTAWITGASSGIGRALAMTLAERGVKVAASARSAERLAALAAAQPGIAPLPVDVTDLAAMRQAAESIAATLGTLELAVFGAGIWEAMSARSFSADKAARAMAVNYQGVVNGLEAALAPMLARGAGHIAVIASVAGYRGLPRTAAYGPTKAALINLAEGLREDLARHGVGISLINPGYVATPMTQGNAFPMPFLVGADAAARRIVRGLEKGRFEIAFPWPMVALMRLARLLPYPLFFAYARTLLAPPRKR